MALKMKDDNLYDDKSPLQASVLVFFIFSTKSYCAIDPQTEAGLNCMISM